LVVLFANTSDDEMQFEYLTFSELVETMMTL